MLFLISVESSFSLNVIPIHVCTYYTKIFISLDDFLITFPIL